MLAFEDSLEIAFKMVMCDSGSVTSRGLVGCGRGEPVLGAGRGGCL